MLSVAFNLACSPHLRGTTVSELCLAHVSSVFPAPALATAFGWVSPGLWGRAAA